ncbi:protein phosphatase CheZ [Vibrio sp.]|nr:protein phosphatase CheZ [Vibrio sp.]
MSISLEEAKQIVSLLEGGKQDEANHLLAHCASRDDTAQAILDKVGQLTRNIHSSLKDIHIDRRMSDLASIEMPEARHSLNHVIDKTELAANRTMDAVEHCMPIVDELRQSIQNIEPSWRALMNGELALKDFKSMCYEMNDAISLYDASHGRLKKQLSDILMAQDYQDLTGQIIHKVIALVEETENKLVNILKDFNIDDDAPQVMSDSEKLKAEGPILRDKEKKNAVENQDDVDDLLSSLGF